MAKVLIVIPHDMFRDEEYQALFDELTEAGHTISVGSTHHTEAKGQYGLIVKPDVNVGYVEPADYDCLVFVGGAGVSEYINDSTITGLITRFYYDRKMIAAIGMSVVLLVYAGILTQKRVTCDSLTASKVADAGAYFTGAGTEWDGNILTGSGYRSSEEFAKQLVKGLKF